MAAPTVSDIRARVEALLALMPEITTIISVQDCPLSDADLPAALVMVRQAARSRTNESWWNVARTISIGVLFTRLCEGTTDDQRTQMLAAEALLEAVPDYFERIDRLALNGIRLDIKQPGDMTDNGLETRPWGGASDVYYACTYEMVITMKRE